MKKSKPIKMWGGFTSGRLYISDMDDGWGGFGEHKRRVPFIFTNYQDAKKQFQDVRRLEIREIDDAG